MHTVCACIQLTHAFVCCATGHSLGAGLAAMISLTVLPSTSTSAVTNGMAMQTLAFPAVAFSSPGVALC